MTRVDKLVEAVFQQMPQEEIYDMALEQIHKWVSDMTEPELAEKLDEYGVEA